jgi:hypothetical protein
VTVGTLGRASFRALIDSPQLLSLFDYWLAKRGHNFAPHRADFDPIDLPKLLPHLILSEVGDGGNEILYRLVGTEIVKAHGYDYTGYTVQRLTSGATLAFTQELYGRIVSEQMPVYSEGHFRWMGKEHSWTKRLHLPLTRGGAMVDMVLACQVFEAPPRRPQETVRAATAAELEADRDALVTSAIP